MVAALYNLRRKILLCSLVLMRHDDGKLVPVADGVRGCSCRCLCAAGIQLHGNFPQRNTADKGDKLIRSCDEYDLGPDPQPYK